MTEINQKSDPGSVSRKSSKHRKNHHRSSPNIPQWVQEQGEMHVKNNGIRKEVVGGNGMYAKQDGTVGES
jgi:hypothetical protein